MALFNKNVNEGLFNPKTVGTNQGQGLAPLGKEYGLGAIQAQRDAMAHYQGMAAGTVPSIANLQMAQGLEMNNRAALGLMGAQRGGNIAGAYSQALGAQTGANLATTQQGAINRLAEQQMGVQGMVGLAGQMAGQQFGYDQLFQGAQLQARGQDLDYNLGNRGLNMQADQNAFNNAMQIGTAGANAAGSILGGIGQMSDERAKVGLGVLPTGEAGAAVGEIQPVAWDRYADPSMGPQGPQTGVSAQQLQGTRLGGLVQPGPDGLLRVDAGGAATTALAASADHEHRMRALEARLAQEDPYASPQMRQMGSDFEVAEGARREREGQRLSNEISAQRGLGQLRRAGGSVIDERPGLGEMTPPRSLMRGGFDRGNVDLYRQPQVRNPDGSISTVDSASFNLDGRETLLPSVTPDGRHLASDDEIVAEYRRTGRHLGRFATPDAASSYAGELHDAYASGAFDRLPPGYASGRESPSPFGPEPVERSGLGAATGRARRRRPGLVQVESGGGSPMRATPVSFGNTPQTLPSPPIYSIGEAGMYVTPMRAQLPLNAAEQEAYDAQLDYLDDWTVTDEAGNRRLLDRPLSEQGYNMIPRGVQRQIDVLGGYDLPPDDTGSPMMTMDELGRRRPLNRRLMRGLGAIGGQGMTDQQVSDAAILQQLIDDQRANATAQPMRRTI